MNADDLTDHRPALDDCDRCSLPWPHCICDAARPRRQASPEEIEAARRSRLTRAELQRGAR